MNKCLQYMLGGGTLHTFPSLYLVGPIAESWRKGGAPCTIWHPPPPPGNKTLKYPYVWFTMGKSTCIPTSFWLKNELRFLKCTVDRCKYIAQSTCVKYIKLIVLFYIASSSGCIKKKVIELQRAIIRELLGV